MLGAVKILLTVFVAYAVGGCRTVDSLSLWNDDVQSKLAIVEYVATVTDESSPDFIPPERRIAVFDLDGTLFCETDPTYFDWMLFDNRVLSTPGFTATEAQKTAARNLRESGVVPALDMNRERIIADAYKDLTLDEFDAFVRKFMDTPQPGYSGLKRGEMFYAPMVQLVEYLVGQGFAVYVVSGSDRFVVRALLRGVLPVPPWRVIGSDSSVVALRQNGADGLSYRFAKDDVPILDGRPIIKNLQMNKVTALIREIGVKPVLSFGNSFTDASMANYVIGGNEYKALAFMLLCDDTARENGNVKKADEMRKACGEFGWIPVSMRDDWKTIYGRKEIKVQPVKGDATSTLQKAFDDCFRAGGGTVTVEKGEYAVKGLRLRSNTTLHLKSGAILKASRNCDDYDILAGDKVEPVPEGDFAPGVVWVTPKKRKTNDHILKCASRWNNAIIRILRAKNVRIVGEPGSVIDGRDSYDPTGEEHFRGVHGISVHESTNLVFRGYTIRNTGNWAHSVWRCADMTFDGLTILGGHDGIHFSVCDRVKIENCTMKTGDDCVAGFDNEDVTVRGCRLNTACSAFRFGGRRVLIEGCRCWGPGEYPIRNSLPKADQIAGTSGKGTGRNNMLSLFTYYSDFTLKVRHTPGDITIRNCTLDRAGRFLHYNFSGNETWQKNRPLSSICFENVAARGVGLSLCAYGDADTRLSLALKDCHISFAAADGKASPKEFIRAAHVSELLLDRVTVEGVDGPCVRSWGDVAEPKAADLKGVAPTAVKAETPFKTQPI